jgi:hypothetical protein
MERDGYKPILGGHMGRAVLNTTSGFSKKINNSNIGVEAQE